MKVCPVCQYEEEDGNEVACAICGSDLESEEALVEALRVGEVPVEHSNKHLTQQKNAKD